ncbi:MAG TPA: PQQ-binding-like beta-propeller repeat protein [Fimbriimonadaceae bacterium]|nr:PQQ-binding-like beta-propeller repeat protein [Fimbriimonadaceae bacterium]
MLPITRRDLLKAGSAAALTPLAAKFARALPRPEVATFAYFSDTHVSLQRNLDECLKLAEEIRMGMQPLFAINGGDVVDYGWKGEYDNYDKVLAAIGCKTHHIPGNHDVRWSPLGLKIFEERVGRPFESFDHSGCHFALLDSTVPLSHWGHYESAQLRWLEEDLKKVGREMPVFLFTHHWVGRDRVMIDNELALLKVIEPYNVKIIFTGHGHSDLLWKWDGITCTQNKGLYQGSYQRVEIDRGRSEVRLYRRNDQRANRLLTTVPLVAEAGKRPVWALSVAALEAGKPLVVPFGVAKEARWNDGAWTPVAGPLETGSLVGGANVLTLREDEGGYQRSFDIKVTKPGARLRPLWERKLSGGVMSHLKLSEGRLYVSAMDGSVYALDRNNGRVIWRAQTGGYCHSSPAIENGRLVVGSADGKVYGLDARGGRKLWEFQTGGPVYASAAFGQGIACIASGDGKVYGLDPANGKPVWTFSLPEGNTAFIQSPAASDGARFYLGAWDNYLYALDARRGTMLWRKICCERTFAFSPAIGGPAVANGRVFVPANGNILYAFDAETGEELWQYTSPGDKVGYSSPRVVGEWLFVGCLGAKGEARCIEVRNGKEMWCATTGAEIYDSSPAVLDEFVAIGSVNGTLSLISSLDGSILSQHRMPPGHFLSSPVMEPKRLYAGTYSDVVVGFEVK